MAWTGITRLGEAQIMLPLMLAALPALLWRPALRRTAAAWCLGTALAVALVTASKVAFMGYGLGVARWDFTGLSGHAAVAFAVWPLLAALLLTGAGASWLQVLGASVPGLALAALVAFSRLPTGAHSASEVLLGSAAGLAAAALALRALVASGVRIHAADGAAREAGARRRGLLRWMAGALAAAYVATAATAAPPAPTHRWVTQMALALSGRSVPFERGNGLR